MIINLKVHQMAQMLPIVQVIVNILSKVFPIFFIKNLHCKQRLIPIKSQNKNFNSITRKKTSYHNKNNLTSMKKVK